MPTQMTEGEALCSRNRGAFRYEFKNSASRFNATVSFCSDY